MRSQLYRSSAHLHLYTGPPNTSRTKARSTDTANALGAAGNAPAPVGTSWDLAKPPQGPSWAAAL